MKKKSLCSRADDPAHTDCSDGTCFDRYAVPSAGGKRGLVHRFAKVMLKRLVDQHLRKQKSVSPVPPSPLDGPLIEPLRFLATCPWLEDSNANGDMYDVDERTAALVDVEFSRLDEVDPIF